MSSNTLSSRVQSLGLRAANMFAPVALLLARLVYGKQFIEAGWGKFMHLDNVTQYFENLGIPLASVQAPFIAAVELLGGIALVLGFGTRIAAFFLSCTMVVAIRTAEWDNFVNALLERTDPAHPDAKVPMLPDVTPVHFLLVLLLLLSFGAGAISLERILARRRERRVPTTT
jgi:uncharacterized membrane protein YphA (DoxX/SURF4 family)